MQSVELVIAVGVVMVAYLLIAKPFDKSAADPLPLKFARLPVTLKSDPSQLAVMGAFGLWCICCIISATYLLFQSGLITTNPKAGSLIPLGFLIIFLLLLFVFIRGLWTAFCKMRDPDRLIIATDGIELYSLGHTRQWSWQEIRDVELKKIATRSGGYQIVYLKIPTQNKPVALPRLLRSNTGPEDEQAIYDLIRALLPETSAGRVGAT